MKRTIEISTRGTRLFLDAGRLVVHREEEDLARIPLEDLGVVVLDSTGVSISSGALKALADAGCAVLACDDTHHPNGLFLPLSANSLHGERVQIQADAGLPLRKNLWARIVQRKILNQAHVCSGAIERGLIGLAAKVRSGDSGHCEAQAARLYWPQLFRGIDGIQQPFRRHRDGEPPNGLLNYGYALVRALIARSLCAAGLHPALGLHHRNRYNGFPLADDLIEPFRPIVDLHVLGLVREGVASVHKESKQRLLEVFTYQVDMSGQLVSVELAAERSAAGLAKAMVAAVKEGESAVTAADHLELPAPVRRSDA